jgi:hypothetical protein
MARASSRRSHEWERGTLRACVTVLLMSIAGDAPGAVLKPETVADWNKYLETVDANLQARVRPGGSFLWTFEDAGRVRKVRGGEIVAAPAPGQNPIRISGGLIHHWMGAAFVPGLKLDDVIAVTRDYDHYQDYYRPSVVKSETIGRNGAEDKFSLLLMNRALFLKVALDADYHAINVRLDDHRLYSTSRTTRMQEVQDYGRPDARRIPEGEGGGYLWKLCSIARFEQRDGGVYIELEAIALSREIPAALRLVAEPIVRRVSRNSLVISLEQTRQAVHGQ